MTVSKTGRGDLYVRIYDPGRNDAGEFHQIISLRATRAEFGQGTLEITVPLEEPALQAEYSGSSMYTRSGSGYGIDLYYRGQVFGSYYCHAMDDEDAEDGGTSIDDIPINVTLRCIDWLSWFMGGRLMMGSGRARFSQNDTADNVLKAMLRANMVSGGTPSLITPADYAGSLYDPITDTGSLTAVRTNFGNSWTIAVAANTSAHPDTVTHRWDSGRSLPDQVREFCRRYDVGLSGSWSGTTYTISTSVPATGSDLTGSMIFDREKGNLARFKRSADRLRMSNLAEVGGLGRRDGQVVSYAFNQSSYNDIGLRETGEVWRSANSQDTQNEARFIMVQQNSADLGYEADLREIDGMEYGDFDVGDKVTIHCSRRSVTVQDYISGLELTMTAPDLPVLRIQTGRPPLNPDAQSRRSGGGGTGSGRGGGHPKGTDGESNVDPDDIKSYFTVKTQNGDVDAESANHYLSLAGSDTATYVRARTSGSDDASSDQSGNPDTVTIQIRGDYTAADVVALGYVKLRDATGTGDIWLLATDTDPDATPGP